MFWNRSFVIYIFNQNFKEIEIAKTDNIMKCCISKRVKRIFVASFLNDMLVMSEVILVNCIVKNKDKYLFLNWKITNEIDKV